MEVKAVKGEQGGGANDTYFLAFGTLVVAGGASWIGAPTIENSVRCLDVPNSERTEEPDDFLLEIFEIFDMIVDTRDTRDTRKCGLNTCSAIQTEYTRLRPTTPDKEQQIKYRQGQSLVDTSSTGLLFLNYY